MDARVSYVSPRDLIADSANPRTADDARMTVLELSLSKLGFVIPIFTDQAWKILSGHQRTQASLNLGIDRVPVRPLSVNDRVRTGAILTNNRATNDFSSAQNGQQMLSDALSLQSELEEMDDMSAQDWPVRTMRMHTFQRGDDLVLPVDLVHDRRAVQLTSTLLSKDMIIPVVVDEEGRILNGSYRYIAARERGLEAYPIVVVENELADLTRTAMNCISMDFDANSAQVKSFLRANAYRRPKIDRGTLARSFRFWADGESTKTDKRSMTADFYKRFKRVHGTSVLDFGSGMGTSSANLNNNGVSAVPFEPYTLLPGSSKPDIAASKRGARSFLDIVESGRKFDSVFLSSVLNSVPFSFDRMCVLTIVHALCDADTNVYGTMRHAKRFNYSNTGVRQEGIYTFDSEPLTKIGDSWSGAPKLQKYMWPEDIERMLSLLWRVPQTWDQGSGAINIFYWKASSPKKVNPGVLARAIRMEFDLPYADGSSMGLADHALSAFGSRLNRDLTRYTESIRPTER